MKGKLGGDSGGITPRSCKPSPKSRTTPPSEQGWYKVTVGLPFQALAGHCVLRLLVYNYAQLGARFLSTQAVAARA